MTKAHLARLKQGLVFLATNFTGAFIIVLAISLVTCIYSISYLTTLETGLTDVFENEIQGQNYAQTAFSQMLIIESAVKDIIIYGDPDQTSRSMDQINTSRTALKAAMNAATPHFYTPAGKGILAQTKKDMNNYLGTLQTAVNVLQDTPNLGIEMLNELKDRKNRLQAELQHLIANKTANSQIGFHELVSRLRLSLICTIVIIVISIGIRVFMYIQTKRQKQP